MNTEDLVPTVPLATVNLGGSGSMRPGLRSALFILGNLDYEHVGIPVSFTKNAGTITDNHVIGTYRANLP